MVKTLAPKAQIWAGEDGPIGGGEDGTCSGFGKGSSACGTYATVLWYANDLGSRYICAVDFMQICVVFLSFPFHPFSVFSHIVVQSHSPGYFTHPHPHTHTHQYAPTHTHTHAHAHAHAHAPAHAHTTVHIHNRTHTQPYACAHTRARTHLRINTREGHCMALRNINVKIC